jgi:hypothetical protein
VCSIYTSIVDRVAPHFRGSVAPEAGAAVHAESSMTKKRKRFVTYFTSTLLNPNMVIVVPLPALLWIHPIRKAYPPKHKFPRRQKPGCLLCRVEPIKGSRHAGITELYTVFWADKLTVAVPFNHYNFCYSNNSSSAREAQTLLFEKTLKNYCIKGILL